MKRGRLKAKAFGTSIVICVALTFGSYSAVYADSYYYGMDSNAPYATTSGCASGWYCMPSPLGSGQKVGSYIGELGTWFDMENCGDSYSSRAINGTDVTAGHDARNQTGNVPGVSLYWFMAGPGADPAFNYSTYTNSDAYNWGQTQARAAMAEYNADGPKDDGLVVFMDIEGPDPQGQYNGWNEQVYSSDTSGYACGLIKNTQEIAPDLDRHAFNGFWDYLENNGTLFPGVYSSQQYWTQTMGGSCDPINNPDACIGNTYQWAYEDSSPSVTPGPSQWDQGGGHCPSSPPPDDCEPQFFGHVLASNEFVWQWSIQSGDWDQNDTSNFG